MTKELTLEVQPRTDRGKNANRRLRTSGKVAGVVYGLDLPPQKVQLERRSIVTMLREGATENSIFLLRMTGSDDHHTMIRELQVDPIDRRILHIDFQRIDLSQRVTVRVEVEIVGVPEGVKNEGGVLDFVTREVEVECLPTRDPGQAHARRQRAPRRPAPRGQGPGPARRRHADRRAEPRHRLGGGRPRPRKRRRRPRVCWPRARRPSPRSSVAARPTRKRKRPRTSRPALGPAPRPIEAAPSVLVAIPCRSTPGRARAWCSVSATPGPSTRAPVTTAAARWWRSWRAGAACAAPRPLPDPFRDRRRAGAGHARDVHEPQRLRGALPDRALRPRPGAHAGGLRRHLSAAGRAASAHQRGRRRPEGYGLGPRVPAHRRRSRGCGSASRRSSRRRPRARPPRVRAGALHVQRRRRGGDRRAASRSVRGRGERRARPELQLPPGCRRAAMNRFNRDRSRE